MLSLKDGVSSTSPLTGMTIDINAHCCLSFGSYDQTHEETFHTNSKQSRTLGAITLGPAIAYKLATISRILILVPGSIDVSAYPNYA